MIFENEIPRGEVRALLLPPQCRGSEWFWVQEQTAHDEETGCILRSAVTHLWLWQNIHLGERFPLSALAMGVQLK